MVRPPTARSAVPGPGRLGLLEPTAAGSLRELAWDNVDSTPVLWALSRSPDADLALLTLIRLREALGSDWAVLDSALRTDLPLRGRLFALIGSSTTFGDHLIADPACWQWLRRDLPTREEMLADLLGTIGAEPETGPNAGPLIYRAAQSGPEVIAVLRKRYRDQLMLLAAHDLAATVENEPVLPYQQVGRHLTDLADAALSTALAVAIARICPDNPVPVRLAVLAMGKCGARELNYVSDVDVVFVAEPADTTATRLAAEMMTVASAFFDVDAALRPEGKAGALVRTLDSHIAYYKRWAKTWEFQALLKNRPAAGDLELGERYRAALMPMVWNASE
ncbi:MAG: bifunctional [glutamine synthetase] adenylyltransferase/[glutamine synthetase]-adenylyl-L-tyrosine phosphorylase, partial [Nocardia sp.]|nr:bifunctional [glutamine synthetase] adenylyltransferase/[glutamine synthetase]-adenylyl-L-tyrosine phosphorylase [Nocardia sp.]